MKAILEFDLDDHTDRMSHLRCTKATSLANFAHDIILNMFKSFRYMDDSTKKKLTSDETMDFFIEYVNRSVEDNGIFIDQLIE
jgi:hypothetical protein